MMFRKIIQTEELQSEFRTTNMAGDLQHIHDRQSRCLIVLWGYRLAAGHPFVGDWATKGLYAYSSGQYSGITYFGTGGSERDRLTAA